MVSGIFDNDLSFCLSGFDKRMRGPNALGIDRCQNFGERRANAPRINFARHIIQQSSGRRCVSHRPEMAG